MPRLALLAQNFGEILSQVHRFPATHVPDLSAATEPISHDSRFLRDLVEMRLKLFLTDDFRNRRGLAVVSVSARHATATCGNHLPFTAQFLEDALLSPMPPHDFWWQWP